MVIAFPVPELITAATSINNFAPAPVINVSPVPEKLICAVGPTINKFWTLSGITMVSSNVDASGMIIVTGTLGEGDPANVIAAVNVAFGK